MCDVHCVLTELERSEKEQSAEIAQELELASFFK